MTALQGRPGTALLAADARDDGTGGAPRPDEAASATAGHAARARSAGVRQRTAEQAG